MLKNDTLKNGTSRIGLYESVPPGGICEESFETSQEIYMSDPIEFLYLHLLKGQQTG